MEDYILYIIIVAIVMLALLLAFITCAGSIFRSTFEKYDQVKNHLSVTPEQFLTIMKKIEKVDKLQIARIEGELTDCYIPKHRTIALSESTFSNNSVAAIAVVAHEFGHSLQHARRSMMYNFYHFFGRVFNFFARFVVAALIIGLIMILATTDYVDIGWIIIYSALGVLGCGILYKILTIPVEYNASNKALKILEEQRVLNQDEIKMARKILSKAAATYVADFLATMLGIKIFRKLRRRK